MGTKRSAVDWELIENHNRYIEKMNIYKCAGYDNEQERKNVIAKAKPLPEKILEIGTGKGYLTTALAQEGCMVTSIDRSAEEQRIAEMNVRYHELEGNVCLKIGNAEDLPFKNKSFDMIILFNVIHHLLDPFAVIDEVIRVVSARGKIVISDFTEEGFTLIDVVHKNEGRAHERCVTTIAEIMRYCEEKNFKIESMCSRYQQGFIAYS